MHIMRRRSKKLRSEREPGKIALKIKWYTISLNVDVLIWQLASCARIS